jgi:RNA polymerase sigma factor (sigma-70 family)
MKSSSTGSGKSDSLLLHIYQEHHDALFYYAKGLCNSYRLDESLAEDFLQEFYIKIHTNQDKVGNGYARSGISYLIVMIRHLFIEACRKGKSLQRLKQIAGMQIPSTTDIYHLCTAIYSRKFREIIFAILPPNQFEIMCLFMDGYSPKEIAALRNVLPGLIYKQINLAKKTIAIHFDRKD